jgi:hypothetical protein
MSADSEFIVSTLLTLKTQVTDAIFKRNTLAKPREELRREYVTNWRNKYELLAADVVYNSLNSVPADQKDGTTEGIVKEAFLNWIKGIPMQEINSGNAVAGYMELWRYITGISLLNPLKEILFTPYNVGSATPGWYNQQYIWEHPLFADGVYSILDEASGGTTPVTREFPPTEEYLISTRIQNWWPYNNNKLFLDNRIAYFPAKTKADNYARALFKAYTDNTYGVSYLEQVSLGRNILAALYKATKEIIVVQKRIDLFMNQKDTLMKNSGDAANDPEVIKISSEIDALVESSKDLQPPMAPVSATIVQTLPVTMTAPPVSESTVVAPPAPPAPVPAQKSSMKTPLLIAGAVGLFLMTREK